MYPVSIKGVVQAPDGRIVLLENERNEWELPGGRIEDGETPQQCLAREIDEELNLQVEVGALVDAWMFEVIPGKRVFIVAYRCTLAGVFTPQVSHEHKRVGLFAPEALPENLPEGYRLAIRACSGSGR
ncbi:NUDIX hydrolase [Herbaspirillum robiniae]|uniref:NUDIX hydrolase n=1 Tax=Herbaspirillum robiniae TaxID=2014887 RepID=A0ABX2LY07_9BURK|nr:NUDIX hydrolase [Herbaspirillum robiniae]NUU02594.1 NUDIX hydrolase [Herbaspirillum robiniae]